MVTCRYFPGQLWYGGTYVLPPDRDPTGNHPERIRVEAHGMFRLAPR
ncbi:MAG TPA: hypothetical protein VMT34_03295 [Aggregatilineales bacterium]|nr:hypothetical protein [Aggregatilineales bacterium]